MKDQIYYYAYGSNLSSARLRARIGYSEYVGNHTLNNYKLVFNCGGFANIEPSEGDIVEGSLYSITSEQLAKLAKYEGFYKMEFFEVNNVLTVIFVALDEVIEYNKRKPSKTSLDYINVILDGMLEKGLETSYDKLLDLKERSFNLSKGNKHKRRR